LFVLSFCALEGVPWDEDGRSAAFGHAGARGGDEEMEPLFVGFGGEFLD
jgi:hypothetical protein